jgi:hypothetical protein
LNKGFIDNVVEEKGNQYQTILHKLSVMEKKFDAPWIEVFSIKIAVHNYAKNQNKT